MCILALSFPRPASAKPADPFPLVKNGKPVATIILAAKPTENAQAAVAELEHYVEKMSGTKLPIANDETPHSGPLILVGRSKLTDAIPGLKIPTGLTRNFTDEGYVLRATSGQVIAAGNDTEPYLGTRYAVVRLLMALGVRWFLPGEFGEVVPKRSTVALEPIDITERPSFPFRDWWEHSRGTMDEEREAWKIHNFQNGRMKSWVGVPGDGSLYDFLPHDQFKAHPDWFAMKRDGTRDDRMACMTSDGMAAAMIDRIKKDAKAGKRVTSFAPEDGAPRCYCENCMKLASAFDGYGSNDRDPWPESSTSQEWFYFVNRILDGVNAEYPDFHIATNGYSNREIAPDLPDFNKRGNLVIMFANISACTIHAYDDPSCWQMRRQGEMVRRWTKVCDKTWLYNYNYTMLVNKGTLTPMVHRIRRNIPLLKKWGAFGFDDQDEEDWAESGIATRVVRARLEWDTGVNVDGVLNDFYANWFGKAAAPIRAYYDALENAFEVSEAHGHEDVILPFIYSPTLMAKLDAAMKDAESAAKSPAEKAHVHLERLMYDHIRDFVAVDKAKQACKFKEAADLCTHMLALKDQMNAITPFMGWHGYPTYYSDWEKTRMANLAALTDGSKGKLIAALPETAKFQLDPYDDGRYAGWFEPDFSDAAWPTLRTNAGWELQGFHDEQGHPKKGVAWYRMNVDVPPGEAGRSIHLLGPAGINEVWCWVNGHFSGHRKYMIPWERPQAFDFDVTPWLKVGAKNQITFRVLSNYDVFGSSGIYERMFLYSLVSDSR